jgi:hypothetical protein
MANPNVAQISASRGSATGAVSYAPLATALPTTARLALNAAFKGLGYVGSDGITPARDISTDDVKDMNGDTVYVLQTDFTRSYEFELLQTENEDVLNLVYGDANVTAAVGGVAAGATVTAIDKGEQQAHYSFVFDTFNVLKLHREVVADAQVESVEIGPLSGTGIRSFKIKLKVFKDSSGNYVTTFDDDGILVP